MICRCRLNGVRIYQSAPLVSHLSFADDCLIFFKITDRAASGLKDVLRSYETLSEQVINYDKSELLLSKQTPGDLKFATCSILGVRLIDGFTKYLGVPISFSNRMIDSFDFLVNRI